MVPALTRVFSNALAGGVSNVSFSDLSADLGRTMYEFKFRIPPYYTLLVRTLSVLEVGTHQDAVKWRLQACWAALNRVSASRFTKSVSMLWHLA